ncbi:MAG: tripartite tricarboxylate transporter substrate binding protein [Betaproteobacteria bacterium]|nr:tripartite tricarboxylate transporter substrate binding protein [Betaproteobacteria bacterium]
MCSLLSRSNVFAGASAIVTALLSGVAGQAPAQSWKPEKNVEIVVGVGPGGGVDRAARLIQKLWQEKGFVGVPTAVVNKPGGGGAVAWNYLNQHPGDGQVIAFITPALITNHLGGRSPLSYQDVTPLAHLGSEYLVFAVKTDSPLKTGKDVVARLRKDSTSLSVAVGSTLGGVLHLAMAQVTKTAGGDARKLRTVVLNSSAESVTALLGGHVDLMVNTPVNTQQQLKSGMLRVIAVAAPERLAAPFAEAPTWKEQGINVVGSNWRGVIGPRGLNQAQIAYWNAALARVAQSEEWRKELERTVYVNNFLTSADARKFLEAQSNELRPLLIELGLAK